MRSLRIAVLACAGIAAGAAPAATRAPAQADASTVVILTRHAEKANDGTDDPELSRAGRSRARALAHALEHERIDAVVTTQYRRTLDTAAPLAQARHLAPEVVNVHEGNYVRRIAELVRGRHAGQSVLVVAHAESVARIIAALGGPRMADLCDWQYGDLYRLVLRPGHAATLSHTRYGAAVRTGRACG